MPDLLVGVKLHTEQITAAVKAHSRDGRFFSHTHPHVRGPRLNMQQQISNHNRRDAWENQSRSVRSEMKSGRWCGVAPHVGPVITLAALLMALR